MSARVPDEENRRKTPADRPRRQWRWRVLRWAALVILLIGSTGLAWLAMVPIPEALLRAPLPPTLTLLDTRGEPLAELADDRARSRHAVALSEMGPDLGRITIALEDRRFTQHHGIDPRALLAALGRDLRAGHVVSGASTITQQLIKLASVPPLGQPRPRRTLLTKAREAAAAWKLESRWTKDEILARYLNENSYGNRLIGPEAAARAYFHKSARSLTLAEAIFLAGLPQAPSRLDPWRHPAAAEYKYQRSVRRLAQLGVIAAAQARDLAESPPHPGHFLPARRAPHFVDALLARRGRHAAAVASGSLRTTLDPDLQRVAESLCRRHLQTLAADAGERVQAAVVILENSNGAVRALVGSGDYADPREGQVNGALRARSAGSALKPFIYLNALDRRMLTAASILPDTAEAVHSIYADYDPQNYTPRHHGPVRVRVALGSSLNVPAVVTLGKIGARQAFYELTRWGFRFNRPFDDLGAGFVLGNAEVRLLDLAAAYAGLARGGVASPARFWTNETASEERIASPEAAAIITDILCDPDARRATFGNGSPLDFPAGVRVAVKTGTSSGFRDKWCVGFNARHTVAVWAGRFDGGPLEESVAIHAAAPLWHELMEHLLTERQDAPLPEPMLSEKLVQVEVCPLTGLRPAPEAGSPRPFVRELFLAGTAPTTSAAEQFVGTPPRLRLPPEYAAWCRSPQNDLNAVTDPEPEQPLKILSPADGAAFVLNDELPPGQQMIELTSTAPDPVRVQWTINGRPLDEFIPLAAMTTNTSSPRADGHRRFWPLARGEWEIEATLPEVAGAIARVRVKVE
ncbi:MAG: transglycosylase domain-containing protein [Verrucomicrobia bacterium]|nr:transglycosylase domain-containing protein [Verrucomicrobiota bacterium]